MPSLRRLLAPALVLVPINALALCVDLFVRHHAMTQWASSQWIRFGLSALASMAAAIALVPLSAAIHRRTPRAAAAIVVLASWVWTWNLLLSVGYFLVLDGWPVATAVQYVIDEPFSSLALARPYLLDPRMVAAFVGGPLLASWLWLWALPRVQRPRTRRFWLLPLVSVGIVVGLSLKPPTYRFAVADVHAFVLGTNMIRLAIKGDAVRLSKPHREVLPPLPRRAGRPHVLVIVNESLGADGIGAFGCPHPVSPRIDAFARGDGLPPGSLVAAFPHAQSNASSTLVSIPSMLTGLAPDTSAIELHTQPLLWQVAKAAGYQTFVHSAQRYDWMQLDQFLLGSGMDHVYTADKSGLPLVNDVGIDDRAMIDATIATIHAFAGRPEPFFGVIQFNATHKPFLPHPTRSRMWTGKRPFESDRFLNAVHYVDDLTGRLLDALRDRGLLDHTVILLTSDHGQGLTGRRVKARIHNYYDEVALIPFLLYLPPGLAPHRDRLMAHRQRRVSNLDIAPTLFDAIGVLDALPASVSGRLAGHSLFRPIPVDRLITFVNVTEYRQWSRLGMALVRGDRKYLFYERELGCEEALYDWRRDPGEKENLWPALTREQRGRWLDTIASRPWLRHLKGMAHCD